MRITGKKHAITALLKVYSLQEISSKIAFNVIPLPNATGMDIFVCQQGTPATCGALSQTLSQTPRMVQGLPHSWR